MHDFHREGKHISCRQPAPLAAGERRLLLATVWSVTLIYVCLLTVADPDLWGHTLYGMRALEQGVLTEAADPFSYTAEGSPWVNHEWLTEYVYGWLWTRGGGLGLWLWRNALVLGVFGVVAWSLRRSAASVAATTVLLVYGAECLAGFCTFIRPQLATFFLFALTLAILREWWRRPGNRWIWALPLVSAAWVNLHGGYLAGLGLMLIFLMAEAGRMLLETLQAPGNPSPAAAAERPGVSDAWRRLATLLGVSLLSLLATLINPYGVGMYTMLWQHLVPEQAVREWQPLWGAWQAPMYYVPFVVMVAALAGSRRWQWIDLLVLAVVSYEAISHIRHVALLCVATMVLLPGPLTDSLERMFPRIGASLAAPRRRWLRLSLVAVALTTLMILGLPLTSRLWRQGIRPWEIAVETHRNPPGVPMRAVELIRREHLAGNLITEYSWGQYVIWHLFPSSRVAFDGRYRTIYPPGLEEQYLAFLKLDANGPERTPLLDEYESELVLLARTTPACGYLATRADWVCVYQDDQAMLFVRDTAKFQPLIGRVRRQDLSPPRVAPWMRFPAGPAGGMPPAAVYPPVSSNAATLPTVNAGTRAEVNNEP
jgi:hypothetical protein